MRVGSARSVTACGLALLAAVARGPTVQAGDNLRPVAEILVGTWQVVMTANYSSCDDISVGDVRNVEWRITAEGDRNSFTAVESGGRQGDPKRYAGELTKGSPPTVMFRAKKQAGAELRMHGADLVGRYVLAKKKGPCAAVYDVVATRTDPPAPEADAGATDPEVGDFTLAEATAGLPQGGTLMAEITTQLGVMTCELFPNEAPRTVASFVGLARGRRAWRDPATGRWVRNRPFFDGLAFHRVIPDFMIQGGDPLSRNYADTALGTGGPGYELPNETTAQLSFDRAGRLAMANAGPDTGGSQFFITEGPVERLNGSYTIFGQCDGLDVVKQVARVERTDRDKPRTAVTMKVRIYRR